MTRQERGRTLSWERFARAIKQDRLANRDKNPAAIFFFIPRPRGGNVAVEGAGGWIPCVPARTKDKRRRRRRLSFVSSVICLAVGFPPPSSSAAAAPPAPCPARTRFPPRGGRGWGPTRWKGCGRYGVAWLERPHLNATGKGLSALSSLRLCRATYATRRHFTAMMGP